MGLEPSPAALVLPQPGAPVGHFLEQEDRSVYETLAIDDLCQLRLTSAMARLRSRYLTTDCP